MFTKNFLEKNKLNTSSVILCVLCFCLGLIDSVTTSMTTRHQKDDTAVSLPDMKVMPPSIFHCVRFFVSLVLLAPIVGTIPLSSYMFFYLYLSFCVLVSPLSLSLSRSLAFSIWEIPALWM